MAAAGAGGPAGAESGYVNLAHLAQPRRCPRRQQAGKARGHARTGRHRHPSPAGFVTEIEQGADLGRVVRDRHHRHRCPDTGPGQIAVRVRRRQKDDTGAGQARAEGRGPQLFEPDDATGAESGHPGLGQRRLA